jgi:phosphoribosylformimino-5-aminoimidazole carboxamide ribotide isomerase
VDLEGAKTGGTPNLELIGRITAGSGLKVEVGGGVRSEASSGPIWRPECSGVILGTAAVTDPDFTRTW